MSDRQRDMVIGSIKEIHADRQAGWWAFEHAAQENEKLKLENMRLKKQLKKLRRRYGM